jgi:hydroxypyruvate reductase
VGTELEEARFNLRDFDRVLVAAFGKAAARMALGLEEVLGDRITGGVAAVKEGHLERLTRIDLIEAAHPVPDIRSVRAATEILGLGGKVNERTLVFILISGGGSSILCAPTQGLELEDKATTTRLLLSSGATIQEINCVRKHLSAVKGGRLAVALAPATAVSLVLSDVIGDDLNVIASGPTVPDPTTWDDVADIVQRRSIGDSLPARVAELIRRGVAGILADTPKPGDPSFARCSAFLIGTNRLALMAAEAKARELGYAPLVLTSRLTGEAREVALMLLGIGEDIAASGFPLVRPACLIAGGETTVTIRGSGKGGRNQEMALAFLCAASRNPTLLRRMHFLAASTDGTDGPTDAAGAFASAEVLQRAAAAGLDPATYLADNDSYHFFSSLHALLKTGPTNTNVCDVQILLVP